MSLIFYQSSRAAFRSCNEIIFLRIPSIRRIHKSYRNSWGNLFAKTEGYLPKRSYLTLPVSSIPYLRSNHIEKWNLTFQRKIHKLTLQCSTVLVSQLRYCVYIWCVVKLFPTVLSPNPRRVNVTHSQWKQALLLLCKTFALNIIKCKNCKWLLTHLTYVQGRGIQKLFVKKHKMAIWMQCFTGYEDGARLWGPRDVCWV